MFSPKDERNRILSMIESGQVSATQAAQLLDTIEGEPTYNQPAERVRERILRIRATQSKQQKTNFSASISVRLVKLSLKLGGRLLPQLDNGTLEDILRAIEHGATGRLLDLQDLEQGERIEIFVE